MAKEFQREGFGSSSFSRGFSGSIRVIFGASIWMREIRNLPRSRDKISGETVAETRVPVTFSGMDKLG